MTLAGGGLGGVRGGGARLQLLARAPQDAYLLSDRPSDSLWFSAFRGYTNFDVRLLELQFPRGFGFGRTNVLRLPGTPADLMGDLFLQLTLPALGPGARWVDGVGHVLLRHVRMRLDDQLLQDQERLWMDLWDRLFCPEARRAGLDELVGRGRTLDAGVPQTLTVPLHLLSCAAHRPRQLWFPLLAAQATRVTFEFETETLEACLVGGDARGGTGSGIQAALLMDGAFLDAEERARLLREPARLVFDCVQDVEAVNAAADDRSEVRLPAVTLRLNEVNRPVRFLAWVAYPHDLGGAYFSYLDVASQAGLYVGSQELLRPRTGDYFRLQQPYAFASRAAPAANVSVYSFCLRPLDLQPTGSLDLSVADNPRLRVDLDPALAQKVVVKAFAVCHAFLEVRDGGARLMFQQ